MTPAPGPGVVVGGGVLLVVLGIGLLAGWAKQRFVLLLVGVVAVVLLGAFYARMTGGLDLAGPRDTVAAQLTGLYVVVLPPLIAFVAGWLVTRGTWLRRLVLLGVAALLLGVLPYAALGAATADALSTR